MEKSPPSNTRVSGLSFFFSSIRVFIFAKPPTSFCCPSTIVEKLSRWECVSWVNKTSTFFVPAAVTGISSTSRSSIAIVNTIDKIRLRVFIISPFRSKNFLLISTAFLLPASPDIRLSCIFRSALPPALTFHPLFVPVFSAA